MTKAELIKALEPFGDDMEVFGQAPYEIPGHFEKIKIAKCKRVQPCCGHYESWGREGDKGIVILSVDD